ncbi:MAG: DUF3019 domain-containing protein [Colwellia sp.]|nr:DUF3019 domain-containing protein [Colwellia sp.]
MSSKQALIPNSIKHLLVVVILLLLNMKVYANEASSLAKLTLTPNQCISLHQGQQCFVTVDISWQVAHAGKYCLFSSLQKNKLTCWLMTKSASFKQELVIEKDVTFTLKLMGDGIGNNIENDEVVVSAVLELAWVHKKSKRSHSAWRVF